MNTPLLISILKQTLVFIVMIMAISFVLDTGIDRIMKEPFGDLFQNWLKSVLTYNKLGIWVLISILYSYFRATRLKR